MDFAQARFNMIEQQIRTWEVLDQSVLDLMSNMPREDFVPTAYRNLAYADTSIPLDHGEVMMPPRVEARLMQALAIGPSDRVLEVGTGSGCLTWQLAQAARHVHSIDIHPEMSAQASSLLAAHGVVNATLETGDALHGWEQHAPYDAIAVTGSIPETDDSYQQQLTVGGRLFVIVGQSPVMTAKIITRISASEWQSEDLFETDLPALIGASVPSRFTL